MKKIEAVIKPFKLDDVKEALHAHDVERQRLRVVVDDAMFERSVEAIQTAAQTGRIGDGKIFVSTIDDAIRIRTGERGRDAV